MSPSPNQRTISSYEAIATWLGNEVFLDHVHQIGAFWTYSA